MRRSVLSRCAHTRSSLWDHAAGNPLSPPVYVRARKQGRQEEKKKKKKKSSGIRYLVPFCSVETRSRCAGPKRGRQHPTVRSSAHARAGCWSVTRILPTSTPTAHSFAFFSTMLSSFLSFPPLSSVTFLSFFLRSPQSTPRSVRDEVSCVLFPGQLLTTRYLLASQSCELYRVQLASTVPIAVFVSFFKVSNNWPLVQFLLPFIYMDMGET